MKRYFKEGDRVRITGHEPSEDWLAYTIGVHGTVVEVCGDKRYDKGYGYRVRLDPHVDEYGDRDESVMWFYPEDCVVDELSGLDYVFEWFEELN
jgi:hypothetical protein